VNASALYRVFELIEKFLCRARRILEVVGLLVGSDHLPHAVDHRRLGHVVQVRVAHASRLLVRLFQLTEHPPAEMRHNSNRSRDRDHAYLMYSVSHAVASSVRNLKSLSSFGRSGEIFAGGARTVKCRVT